MIYFYYVDSIVSFFFFMRRRKCDPAFELVFCDSNDSELGPIIVQCLPVHYEYTTLDHSILIRGVIWWFVGQQGKFPLLAINRIIYLPQLQPIIFSRISD